MNNPFQQLLLALLVNFIFPLLLDTYKWFLDRKGIKKR